MRICFVSRRFFPAISGMSVYAANLLREMVAAGHDVTMISQYRGDARGIGVYGGGPPPPVPGVRVIGLEQLGEQDGGDFEADIDRIVDTIVHAHEQQSFDILHAQYGYPCGWAALLASHRIGVPSLVSIQGGDGHWVGSCCETHRLAMVRVLDHAGAVLIGCRSFADAVTARLGTAPERFTIVPGAVDVQRFHPHDRPPSDTVELLYHGRVDARKGVLDLVRAAAILCRRGVGFSLRISGIGPDVESTRALVTELGVQSRVRMTGPVAYDDVPAVYENASIFVSPTYAEGFSNTILEAMASGLAVVSCRTVGVVDCIECGRNGLLVEPGDIDALAEAMRRMIEDAPERRRLAEAGLADCRRLYSWAAVGAQVMGIYDGLVGSAPELDWSASLPVTPCRFRADPHLL